MKKKFLIFTLLFFILTSMASFKVSAEKTDVDILDFYSEIIENSAYRQYALYDIDKNGVEELILVENPNAKFSESRIYTYSNNEVIDLGTQSIIYGIYSFDGNGILYADGGTGLLCHNRLYIENNILKTEEIPYISRCIAPGIEEYACEGKKISKEQYDSLSKNLSELDFKDIIVQRDTIRVFLDGKELTFDQSPLLINDRVMVPIRVVFEALGYNVTWDNLTQVAISAKENNFVIVQINNPKILYSRGEYLCDVYPQILSDRTLVPLRAISECSGCIVNWNANTQTVTITSN